MDPDVVTVRANVTLDVVTRYLRMKGELPPHTNLLFVVDRFGKYKGVLSLRRLLTNDPEKLVAEVMRTDIDGVPATMSAIEVARFIRRSRSGHHSRRGPRQPLARPHHH